MARLNIKPAASGMSHHSFDVSTIASLDFGELLPTRIIETVKKDHFTKISANGILRLSPQIFPAYGKCFVKSAAFYVPEYQLFEASDAFHSNMNTWKGNNVVLPYFNNDEINYLLTVNQTLGVTSTLVASLSNPTSITVPARDTYDFVYITDNNTVPVYNYYKLTPMGCHFYKILKSLGYEFAYYPYDSSYTFNQVTAEGRITYNALPLLAYFKVYADFFLNPQFYNNSILVAFLNSVQFGKSFSQGSTPWYDSTTGLITWNAIYSIIKDHILLPHQGGMYLDSWNSPNSPDGVSPSNSMLSYNPNGLISPFVDSGAAGVNSNVNSDSNINFQTDSSNSNIKYLSAVGLRILQQFDKFVKRRGLSGNKSVERIYSMFGIKSDFFSSHYCHKIFDAAQRIDFNAVLSNSNTVSSSPGMSGSSLGSYAGYASSPLNFSFEHKCDSFGYIICVSWLQVVPMLLHGVSPTVLRRYPFDFYTPEYDGQTVRAIPHCEVAYVKSGLAYSANGNSPKNVFGYCNLYDDYRNMKDTIVGDFVTSGNVKNFLFGRDISRFYETASVPIKPQSNSVHYYERFGLNNIDMTDPFQLSLQNGDRFYLQLDFNIEADRPIKSESDAINLNGEGELAFSMNGNSMS